jgi:hypothetical protein
MHQWSHVGGRVVCGRDPGVTRLSCALFPCGRAGQPSSPLPSCHGREKTHIYWVESRKRGRLNSSSSDKVCFPARGTELTWEWHGAGASDLHVIWNGQGQGHRGLVSACDHACPPQLWSPAPMSCRDALGTQGQEWSVCLMLVTPVQCLPERGSSVPRE